MSSKETIRVLCALLVMGAGVGVAAQDVGNRAFLELTTDRSEYFVGQAIRVRIRFGIERTFLEKNVLQIFQDSLAVPVQLLVPWWEQLPGATRVPDPKPTGRDRVTFALNGKIAFAHRTHETRPGGERIVVLEIARTFLAGREGALPLPAPQLRFGYATKFREDFINGRVAEDSRSARVEGKPIELSILPIPDGSRVPGFTGGVGTFGISAEVTPREVTVGDSVKLVLRIEGDGNLSSLRAPSLDDLAGFHVRGKVDDRGSAIRTITYDVMVVREVDRLPRIPFAFFEPNASPGFRTVHTAPVPLVVRPLPEGKTIEIPGTRTEPPVAGENDIFDIKPGAGSARSEIAGGTSSLLLIALLVLPWVAALGLRSWFRVRRTHKQPHRVRARGAAASFRSKVIGSGENVADALAEYIAARLHVPVSAVIGHDLSSQLEDAGVSPELSARASDLLHDLFAARYGGAAAADGREAAEALVEALEDEFPPTRGQG